MPGEYVEERATHLVGKVDVIPIVFECQAPYALPGIAKIVLQPEAAPHHCETGELQTRAFR